MAEPLDTKETAGVILIATGKKYIDLAIQSAWSIRRSNPQINIHLFADWQAQGYEFQRSCEPFSSVENVSDPHYRSKVDYACKTPYDRTIYLDTDTKVVTDLSDVFKVLDRFDIALAHAPERVTRLRNYQMVIPDSFPQFNAGVMVYKKTEKVLKVLTDWKNTFHEAKFRSDQITLREALWKSDLRIATLPPEYNLRFLKYILFWNKREARPKILHLHFYRRGIFWFLFPWFMSVRIMFRKISKSPDVYR